MQPWTTSKKVPRKILKPCHAFAPVTVRWTCQQDSQPSDKRLEAALACIRELKPVAEKFHATLNDDQKTQGSAPSGSLAARPQLRDNR